jgi:hypothetical protein
MESPVRRAAAAYVPSRIASVLVLLLGTVTVGLVVPSVVSAALTEYRVRFEPSPTPAAVGYTLHVGTTSRDYTVDFDLGNPPASGGTVVYALDLEDSVDLFMALRAYDDAGDPSEFSNEMRVPATAAPSGGDEPSSGGSNSEPPTSDPGSTPPPDEPTGTDPNPVPDPVPPTDVGADTERSLALATTADGQIFALLGELDLTPLTMDSLAARGDLRPARCDLDGDGDSDLVIGFGSGSGGKLVILLIERGAVVGSKSLDTASASYRSNPDAETNPGCGDMDGDGLGEIVVGFGSGFAGRLQVFDDHSTGYAPMSGRAFESGGILKIQRRRATAVALFPAVGDIDGDGREELIVGAEAGSDLGLVILDDALSGFKKHPSVEGRRGAVSPAPASAAGPSGGWTRRPALGDLDGDGFDEIVVAFGERSGGELVILDDARWGYKSSGSPTNHYVVSGRSEYRSVDGETRVALGDIDDDGIDEIVVGFMRSSRHEVQLFDDLLQNNAPMNDSNGFVSAPGVDVPLFPSPNP